MPDTSSLNAAEYRKPDLITNRGGVGPIQPIWWDVQLHSTEWYRRYRVWHLERWPDSDNITRFNLDMLVKVAEERDAYRVEADCAMRDYEALELEHGLVKEDRDQLLARATRGRGHDYSGMGF